jgi:AraC-like DNA-binding protein
MLQCVATFAAALLVFLNANAFSQADTASDSSSDTGATAQTVSIDSLESVAQELVDEPLHQTETQEVSAPSTFSFDKESSTVDTAAAIDKPDSSILPAGVRDSVADTGFALLDELPSALRENAGKIKRFAAAAKNGTFRILIKKYLPHFFIITGLILLIVAGSGYLAKARDSRRFLTTTRLSVVDKEVRRACNYVEKHFSDTGLSVDTLSDALVTGAPFLQALFDRELGMSVEEFVRQVRMNRSRIIMGEKPGIPSDELAQSVGYTAFEAFAADFLAVTGISFDEYRENTGV